MANTTTIQKQHLAATNRTLIAEEFQVSIFRILEFSGYFLYSFFY